MRTVFIIILVLHGLIHFMGFSKAFNMVEIKELTLQISRPMGILWLLAGLLFLVSLAFYLAGNEVWWIVAIPALVLSQWLIILYWQDAKFGTIANAIILVVAIIAGAGWNFHRHASKELDKMLPDSLGEIKTITPEMTGHLPPIVQKWLHGNGITGKQVVKTAHLEQVGEMRTAPEGKWMPVRAEQWFITEEPGFLWLASVKAAPGITLSGRDRYYEGKGHMLIKLLSLITVADATGEKTDQGTLIRFLSEIIWFPSAALNEYIQWEALDSLTAKATMQYGNTSGSGIFRFDPEGRFRSFEAQRYYDRKKGATMETWYVEADTEGHKNISGILVPAMAEVTWKLKDGDFTWYKLEITDLEYNRSTSRNSR
jgi:hypothetical protein